MSALSVSVGRTEAAPVGERGALHDAKSWIRPASITAVADDGRLEVRVSRVGTAPSEPVTARLADLLGYRPAIGDRVLVAAGEEGAFVIAVLHAAKPRALVLPDGSSARLESGAIEVFDGAGNLLVRCADGCAEVVAPRRDLTLSAPHGRIVMQAGTDVVVEAARDLTQRAGRSAEVNIADTRQGLRVDTKTTTLESARVSVVAGDTHVAAGKVALTAKTLATTVERVVHNVAHYELYAERLVERARDSVREVSGLAEARLGRARTVVSGLFSLRTRRVVMLSKEDTSIDGERILLG